MKGKNSVFKKGHEFFSSILSQLLSAAKSFKSRKRKIAYGFLSLVLAVSMLPLGAFGTLAAEADYAAQIGTTKYETLNAAFDAVKISQTITLLKDVVVDAPINVSGIKSFTFDLNGKTVESNKSKTDTISSLFYLNFDGNFAIQDSSSKKEGKIIGYPSFNADDSVFCVNKGTLVLNGAAIEAVNLNNDGKPNIGSAVLLKNSGKLTMYDGTISANTKNTVYASDSSSAIVYAGLVENLNMSGNNGIAMDFRSGGTLELKGGTIYSKKYFALYIAYSGAKVIVSGGTVRSELAGAAHILGQGLEFLVSGGSFEGYTENNYGYAVTVGSGSIAVFTGGEVCNTGNGRAIGGYADKIYIAGGSPVFRTYDLSKKNMSAVENMNIFDLTDYLGDCYYSYYSDGRTLEQYTGGSAVRKYITFKEDGHTPIKLNLETNGGKYFHSQMPKYYSSEKGYVLPTGSRMFKEGHTFLGWTETNAPSDTNYITEIPAGSASEKTYYAKWQINQYKLTVRFSGPSWAVLPATYETYVTYGDAYSYTVPQVTGCTPDKTIIEGTMSAGNLIVTGQYSTAEYKISFVLNGGSFVQGTSVPAAFYYRSTLIIDLPAADKLTRQGYTFLGWTLTNDPSDTIYVSSNNNLTPSDITYYAKWADVEAPTGNILLSKNISFNNPIIINRRSDDASKGWLFDSNINARFAAQDTSGEKVDIKYFVEVNPTGLTTPSADDSRWLNFSSMLSFLSASDSYVIHAKLTDPSGNVRIISSDIFTLFGNVTSNTDSITHKKGSLNYAPFTIYNKASAGYQGHALKEIRIGDRVLQKNADYTLSKTSDNYDRIQLNASFLNTLPLGEYTLTLSYNHRRYILAEPYEGSDKLTDVTINLSVEKGAPTIELQVSPQNQTRPGSVTLSAVLPADATGTLTFKAGTDVIATVPVGQSVQFTPAGSYDSYAFTVEYSGDSSYNSAVSAAVPYTFRKGIQAELSFDENFPAVKTYGDADFTLGAIGGSGSGNISFTVLEGPARIINGNKVRITGAGTVTIRATKAGDNDYNPITVDKSFTVNKKTVTISGISVSDKVYDGTDAAEIIGEPVLNGVVSGDSVGVMRGTAFFQNKNAGTWTVYFTDFALTGTDAGNYLLASQPAPVTARITKAPLNISVVIKTKQYNGLNDAQIESVNLSGLISGDNVAVAEPYPIARFTSVNAGKNIPVVFEESFSLIGTHADNYELIQPTNVTGSIENSFAAVKGIHYTTTTNEWANSDFVITAMPGYKLSRVNNANAIWYDYLVNNDQGHYTTQFYVKDEASGLISQIAYESCKIDKEAPTAQISVFYIFKDIPIDKNFGEISFGSHYFDASLYIIIQSIDSLSGVKSVEYYLSSDILTLNEVKDVTDWNVYDDMFLINPDRRAVVYVKVTDNAGNADYFASNGIIIDATAPTVTGIEDGAVYCGKAEFSVYDENFGAITDNSYEITAADGRYVITEPGEHLIIVYDNAGNTKVLTITVNAEHTYDSDCDADCGICGEERVAPHSFSAEWRHDETHHWHECAGCGAKTDIAAHIPEEDDGDCTTPDLCSVCGAVLSAATEHDFTGECHHDAEGHWHECANDGCTVLCEKQPHEWDEGTVILQPTARSKGTMLYTCLVCGETRTVDIPMLPPVITKGKGSVWNPKSAGTIVFKSSAAFGDFVGVRLNGESLDESNYEAAESEDGIVVTLKEEYLKTLPTGTYTIGIESVGGIATAEFTVTEPGKTDSLLESIMRLFEYLAMILAFVSYFIKNYYDLFI